MKTGKILRKIWGKACLINRKDCNFMGIGYWTVIELKNHIFYSRREDKNEIKSEFSGRARPPFRLFVDGFFKCVISMIFWYSRGFLALDLMEGTGKLNLEVSTSPDNRKIWKKFDLKKLFLSNSEQTTQKKARKCERKEKFSIYRFFTWYFLIDLPGWPSPTLSDVNKKVCPSWDSNPLWCVAPFPFKYPFILAFSGITSVPRWF